MIQGWDAMVLISPPFLSCFSPQLTDMVILPPHPSRPFQTVTSLQTRIAELVRNVISNSPSTANQGGDVGTNLVLTTDKIIHPVREIETTQVCNYDVPKVEVASLSIGF